MNHYSKILDEELREGDNPGPLPVHQNQNGFTELHHKLLTHLLDETRTIKFQRLYKRAADEAAALAWTTPFPGLVFPALFAEKTDAVRQHARRQQQIEARMSGLLANLS